MLCCRKNSGKYAFFHPEVPQICRKFNDFPVVRLSSVIRYELKFVSPRIIQLIKAENFPLTT